MSGDVRNGTMVTSMPAVVLNNAAARFWVLPGLMVPTFSLPGFWRAALMMSCTDLSGDSARVTIRRSKKDVVEAERKSGGMRKGRVGKSAMLMELLLPVISRV